METSVSRCLHHQLKPIPCLLHSWLSSCPLVWHRMNLLFSSAFSSLSSLHSFTLSLYDVFYHLNSLLNKNHECKRKISLSSSPPGGHFHFPHPVVQFQWETSGPGSPCDGTTEVSFLGHRAGMRKVKNR